MSIENVFNTAWEYASKYVFGADAITGMWFLLIFFGIGAQLKVEFSILLVFLIPMMIVFMATGAIPGAVGAVYLFIASIALGFSWWQNR